MPMPFRKKTIIRPDKPPRDSRKYIDLNEYQFSDEPGPGTAIKIGEIVKFEDVPQFSEVVYNGDVLILDYGAVQSDELLLKRIVSELKRAANDNGGDVVVLGNKYIIVTPRGMKIDRNKIRIES
ncbi:MAG: cell division protein SepF [Thermoplasmata archaeon]|jgi:SepF-like predicted cell division protein (DUF552 family)